MDSRVIEIRDILDQLALSENESNDQKEMIFDRELGKLSKMERSGIIEVIERAIGSDKLRRRFSAFVFSEFHDVTGIDRVFVDLLASSDADLRSWIIQTVGLRKMRNLVPFLNEHFASEADDFCRTCLLSALAEIADPSSLPIFEYLIRGDHPRDQWVLLVAATRFSHPMFGPFLRRVFDSPDTNKSHKVMAAWALAKSGDKKAIEYLIEMLDDPEIRQSNHYDPGESLRASQALSDINGWEFEWDRKYVSAVKQRLKQA